MATPPLALMTLPGSYESLSAHTRLHTPLQPLEFLEMTQRDGRSTYLAEEMSSVPDVKFVVDVTGKREAKETCHEAKYMNNVFEVFPSKSSHRDEAAIPVAQKNIHSLILHDCIHSRMFSLLVTEASREILF